MAMTLSKNLENGIAGIHIMCPCSKMKKSIGKLLDNRKHLERDMERRFEICRLDG